jgi:hypothetical protein
MLLLEEVGTLSLPISEYSNGTYYFVAVAFNDVGNRTSNCVNVTIAITPSYNNDPPNNDPPIDDPNPNYPIEMGTVLLFAIGSIGVPTGTILAFKKVKFAKKAKERALNN